MGEVATIGGGPFVVLLDQDRAGQSEQGCGVGEYPDDVGASLDFLVDSLEGIGRPDPAPVRAGEPGEREQVLSCSGS